MGLFVNENVATLNLDIMDAMNYLIGRRKINCCDRKQWGDDMNELSN